MRFGRWRISVYDFETGSVTVLPGQDGRNLNPQWAPDGQSLAFISDRTGIPQLFLYDVAKQEHYQLTRFIGGVLSFTEYSPAVTWARDADKLAFTYMDNGDFTIWSVTDPRQLKKAPFVPVVATVADAPVPPPTPAPDTAGSARRTAESNLTALAQAVTDSIARSRVAANPERQRSMYRATDGLRMTSVISRGEMRTLSVAALLDSANLSLPDPASFRSEPYKGTLRPEYVARPQVGYAQDNFNRGVYGGTMIVLADLIGNKRLALAGGINGRLAEAQLFAQYVSLGGRRQYSAGMQQSPYFFFSGESFAGGGGLYLQTQVISRYIQRNAYLTGLYPQNRFKRFEYGAMFTNVDRSLMYISQGIDLNVGYSTGFILDSIVNYTSLNYVSPYVAYVKDNAIFGTTGAIYGQRYRFQLEKIAGNVSWMNYFVDYRRYDAVLFNFLTLASRVTANVNAGPDEQEFQQYLGRADFVRGYDRELYSGDCSSSPTTPSGCGALQLLGSRLAFANVELRFPLVRRVDLGVLPITLPPVDGLFFYDFGMAWSRGHSLSLTQPDNYDPQNQRYPLRSYGFGIRLNLFNVALMRWDYAVPRDGEFKKGYWYWTIGQSF